MIHKTCADCECTNMHGDRKCQYTRYKDRTGNKGQRTRRVAAERLIRRQVSELHRLRFCPRHKISNPYCTLI